MDAPKVTQARIDGKIVKREFVLMPDGRTTICQLTMENGFTIRGESSCVDIRNYDKAIGERIALENAVRNVWQLEGYLLAQQQWEKAGKS